MKVPYIAPMFSPLESVRQAVKGETNQLWIPVTCNLLTALSQGRPLYPPSYT